MQTYTIFFTLTIVCVTSALGEAVHWSCESTWTSFKADDSITCIKVGSNQMSSMLDASKKCKDDFNASLVVIDSEKKLTFIDETIAPYHKKFWMGMQKFPNGIKWFTKDGSIPAKNLPSRLQYSNWFDSDYYNLNYGLLYSNGGYLSRPDRYYSNSGLYICERRADCAKGYYGKKCENKCNCHGTTCDPADLEGNCPHGCQVGWMGNGCNKVKEDADVEYMCVSSEDQGTYAQIRVNTKGVEYDNIRAVDKSGDWIDWCNNTEVAFDHPSSIQTIIIPLDNDTIDDMKHGLCAGLRTADAYTWTIKLQEVNGFQSRDDKDVVVSCKDSEYDALTMSGKTAIEFAEPDAEQKERTEEKVTLEIVDAYHGTAVSKARIGSSVVLKVRFDHGNDASGVVPFNCDATTSDGSHSMRLLNSHGCPMEGSIISPFKRNGTHSLITNAFPLLRFPGARDIEFRCSYTLCFDGDDCPLGCVDSGTDDHSARRRRSVEPVERRIVDTIRVDIV